MAMYTAPLAFWLACGAICLAIAQAKGLNGPIYLLFGSLLGPIGVIITVVIALTEQDTPVEVGGLVQTTRPMRLEDGTKMRRGHTSKAHQVDARDGRASVEIDGPDGVRHWVLKRNVRGA